MWEELDTADKWLVYATGVACSAALMATWIFA